MLNPAISLLNLEATNAGIFEPAEDISSTVEKGNAVLCYCIVTPSKDHQGFVKEGDSGSLVVLNRQRPEMVATVVGIITGGDNDRNLGYMAPTDLSIDHIEQAMGATVGNLLDIGTVEGSEAQDGQMIARRKDDGDAWREFQPLI